MAVPGARATSRSRLTSEASAILLAIADRVRSRHLFAIDVLGSLAAALLALVAWRDGLPGVQDVATYLWVIGVVVATRIVLDVDTWRGQ